MTAEPGTMPAVLSAAERLSPADVAMAEHVAELTAAKIARSLLRLPPSVAAVLAGHAGGGYYLNSVWFGTGAMMHEIRVYMRITGLELRILDAQGCTVWQAELIA